MKITILGSSHGDPTINCNTTSILVQAGGKNYLVDAGEGCNRGLVLQGLAPSFVHAVIITHMHIDHTSGLPMLAVLAQKYRRYAKDIHPVCLLPDERAADVLKAWCDVNYDTIKDMEFRTYHEGEAYSDDAIRITAYPNEHLSPIKDREAHSYSLKIEAEGKSVIFSGDISDVAHDFSDFNVDAAKDCDIAFLELTHYNPDKALKVWEKLRAKKVVFYHMATACQTEDGQIRIRELCRDLPFPVDFSYDNKQFVL